MRYVVTDAAPIEFGKEGDFIELDEQSAEHPLRKGYVKEDSGEDGERA